MARNGTDGATVGSDETLFAIIEQLRERDGAGVTELAAGLGLAKSSVHKHLRTMVEHGYAVNRDGTYHVGLEFFRAGEYARDRYDIYHAAKDPVDDLAAETGEMAWLIVEENGRAMYLYGSRGDAGVSVEAIVGTWRHLHVNSGGKAILAHLPDDEVERILDAHGLPARTENTVTDRGELRAELDRIRERGYAVNRSEDLHGIHAIGAPVRHDGAVRGALAVAGAARRLARDDREADLAERLLTATDDVEVNLAYQ
ncbi:DNA-binding IclR family transcriptional regulator [Halarchaeum rubridurum]|uniref:IclR family transcriptional regulator n=1 Tax=Halarchaeum rubridurum TaxID=489911 RepID=A0A830FQI8_9EURY|nr:IclR family transcriptional regulator [Halarchaeum rubridurum]MBP1954451.1 DNA-binding IclR family transcriptional regulator [Halarchaeum rubridurum]GGM61112.1 IclR family transcriptional regulator [Halarchaeum rubridurum]